MVGYSLQYYSLHMSDVFLSASSINSAHQHLRFMRRLNRSGVSAAANFFPLVCSGECPNTLRICPVQKLLCG